MKIVHEEAYRGLKIVIRATFDDQIGIRLNSKEKWHRGEVILNCDIIDIDKEIIKTFNTSRDYDTGNYEFQITYQRKFNRTGFFNMKKDYYIVHIKDEYQRVLDLYIRRVVKYVDNILDEKERKKINQEITDGLPDSLLSL